MPATFDPVVVLIGAVSYEFLQDVSFGSAVLQAAKRQTWPDSVIFEDLSHGPISVLHQLKEMGPWTHAHLIGSVQRGRVPGQLYRYRLTKYGQTPEEVQESVTEAVTGVISVANTATVLRQFEVLPSNTTWVWEFEPVLSGWGDGLSPQALVAVEECVNGIRRVVEAVQRGGADNGCDEHSGYAR